MTRSNADREEIVSELLLDAGLSGDVPLKAALESIGRLSCLPAPAPDGELAAMLGVPPATPVEAGTPEDELGKRRRLGKRRSAIIAGAVVTAMGLGIGGVAASGGFQKNSPEFLEHLIAGWAPEWNPAPPSLVPAAPTPDAPKVTTVPAPSSPPAAKAPQAVASPAPAPPPTPAVAPVPAPAAKPPAPVSKVPAPASKAPASKAPASKTHAKSPSVKTVKAAAVPVKAKTNQGNGKEQRLADAARLAKKSAGKSRVKFLEALERVLGKRGLMGGSTVEEILRWMARLGIRY